MTSPSCDLRLIGRLIFGQSKDNTSELPSKIALSQRVRGLEADVLVAIRGQVRIATCMVAPTDGVDARGSGRPGRDWGGTQELGRYHLSITPTSSLLSYLWGVTLLVLQYPKTDVHQLAHDRDDARHFGFSSCQ